MIKPKYTEQRGHPETFGCLRRKDLESGGDVVYEMPNGKLICFHKDQRIEMVRLKIDMPLKP